MDTKLFWDATDEILVNIQKKYNLTKKNNRFYFGDGDVNDSYMFRETIANWGSDVNVNDFDSSIYVTMKFNIHCDSKCTMADILTYRESLDETGNIFLEFMGYDNDNCNFCDFEKIQINIEKCIDDLGLDYSAIILK
jgi:hypothetical protein